MKLFKVIVLGSTGKQAGAVVTALVAAKKWTVLAITRDPLSTAASRLAKIAAEVIKADPADQFSLLVALQGAYGKLSVAQPLS